MDDIEQEDPNNQEDPEDPNEFVSSFLAHRGASSFLNKLFDTELEKYYSSIQKGRKRIDNHTASLFSDEKAPDEDSEKSKKTISDWMDKGSNYEDIQQALGGQTNVVDQAAQPNSISSNHPQQSLLIQSAKGRISDYLNGLKPQKNLPKLAFDNEPDQTEKQRSYDKALDIAADPLSILNHVSRGTLSPEQVKHFNAMYPEVNNTLQKKLTDQIIKAQLQDKKPSYKIRQGLSLLMGTPLSGELTPQSMQAIQATFQIQAQQDQTAAAPVKKNKKNTSTLSKSSQSFLTGNQALTGRQQKQ